MLQLDAIAAMSLNRVIGSQGRIPWHLPEDFKWFKRLTTGHIIVMGRRTFESIGRLLPNRTTVVLTRSGTTILGATTISDLGQLEQVSGSLPGKRLFIVGGANVYEQALPSCSNLYLTLVNRTIEGGDAFFPAFEDRFELVAQLEENPEFRILHYRNPTAAQL